VIRVPGGRWWPNGGDGEAVDDRLGDGQEVMGLPLVGARREQLAETRGAVEVTLTAAEGSRYNAHQMAMLDRER